MGKWKNRREKSKVFGPARPLNVRAPPAGDYWGVALATLYPGAGSEGAIMGLVCEQKSIYCRRIRVKLIIQQ